MAIRSKHINAANKVVDSSSLIRSSPPISTSPCSDGVFSHSHGGNIYSSSANHKRRHCSRKIDQNGSVVGLLEAMKDSSPPRMRYVQPDSFPDMQYNNNTWMAKHPSALDNFDRVMEPAKGKPVFVFLDYDGTLSPIVEDPERAFMSEEMRAAVKEMATLFPTAIITGRSREKVYEFVQLPELYYAGSHGMDIMGPLHASKSSSHDLHHHATNELALFQPANEFTVTMNEVFKLLDDKAKKVPGAKVEHNKFCVSVHFRCVKEEDWMPLAEMVQNVLKSYPKLHLTQGRKVLEVRPCISWNKGKALDYLLRTLDHDNRKDVFPIYIGDDQTDEDAFKAISKKNHGLPILVSNVVKETNATFSLRNPDEVLQFLLLLVKWKRKCINSCVNNNPCWRQRLATSSNNR